MVPSTRSNKPLNTTTPSLIGLCFAVTLIPLAANAEERPAFNFNPHELETRAGALDVYKRMDKQATSLCQSNALIRSQRSTLQQCVSIVLADWVKDANHPTLTSVHESG